MQSDPSKYQTNMHPQSETVRRRAQWIAERLVRAGVEEDKSMRIAIATAKRWLDAEQAPATARESREILEE